MVSPWSTPAYISTYLAEVLRAKHHSSDILAEWKSNEPSVRKVLQEAGIGLSYSIEAIWQEFRAGDSAIDFMILRIA